MKYFYLAALALFFSMAVVVSDVFSQTPSFEIAPYPEPTIQNTVASPLSGPAGTVFTVNATAWDISGIGSVIAHIQNPDETNIALLTLYDDGMHGDGAAGDGRYGNLWDSSGRSAGVYYVDIVANDVLGYFAEANNGANFTLTTSGPPTTTTIPYCWNSMCAAYYPGWCGDGWCDYECGEDTNDVYSECYCKNDCRQVGEACEDSNDCVQSAYCCTSGPDAGTCRYTCGGTPTTEPTTTTVVTTTTVPPVPSCWNCDDHLYESRCGDGDCDNGCGETTDPGSECYCNGDCVGPTVPSCWSCSPSLYESRCGDGDCDSGCGETTDPGSECYCNGDCVGGPTTTTVVTTTTVPSVPSCWSCSEHLYESRCGDGACDSGCGENSNPSSECYCKGDCGGGGWTAPSCWTCSPSLYESWCGDGACDGGCGENSNPSSECYCNGDCGGGPSVPSCWNCDESLYESWCGDGACDSGCGETTDGGSECYCGGDCGGGGPTTTTVVTSTTVPSTPSCWSCDESLYEPWCGNGHCDSGCGETTDGGSECYCGGDCVGGVPSCWSCDESLYNTWCGDGACDSGCGETTDSGSECYCSGDCGGGGPTSTTVPSMPSCWSCDESLYEPWCGNGHCESGCGETTDPGSDCYCSGDCGGGVPSCWSCEAVEFESTCGNGYCDDGCGETTDGGSECYCGGDCHNIGDSCGADYECAGGAVCCTEGPDAGTCQDTCATAMTTTTMY